MERPQPTLSEILRLLHDTRQIYWNWSGGNDDFYKVRYMDHVIDLIYGMMTKTEKQECCKEGHCPRCGVGHRLMCNSYLCSNCYYRALLKIQAGISDAD